LVDTRTSDPSYMTLSNAISPHSSRRDLRLAHRRPGSGEGGPSVVLVG